MLYIAIILFILAVIFYKIEERRDWDCSVHGICLIVGVGIITIFFFLLMFSKAYVPVPDTAKIESEDTIVSLSRENETDGRFTLGSGTVKSGRLYYCLIKDKDGYLLEKSIPVEKTKIKLTTDGSSPKISTISMNYGAISSDSAFAKIFKAFLFFEYPAVNVPVSGVVTHEYILSIPEDSVILEYNVQP